MSENDKSNESAAVDVPDQLTIILRKPVTLGSETYDSITVNEPTVGQIEAFAKESDRVHPLQAMNNLVATVSGVNKAAINLMSARDGKKARDFLANFL